MAKNITYLVGFIAFLTIIFLIDIVVSARLPIYFEMRFPQSYSRFLVGNVIPNYYDTQSENIFGPQKVKEFFIPSDQYVESVKEILATSLVEKNQDSNFLYLYSKNLRILKKIQLAIMLPEKKLFDFNVTITKRYMYENLCKNILVVILLLEAAVLVSLIWLYMFNPPEGFKDKQNKPSLGDDSLPQGSFQHNNLNYKNKRNDQYGVSDLQFNDKYTTINSMLGHTHAFSSNNEAGRALSVAFFAEKAELTANKFLTDYRKNNLFSKVLLVDLSDKVSYPNDVKHKGLKELILENAKLEDVIFTDRGTKVDVLVANEFNIHIDRPSTERLTQIFDKLYARYDMIVFSVSEEPPIAIESFLRSNTNLAIISTQSNDLEAKNWSWVLDHLGYKRIQYLNAASL